MADSSSSRAVTSPGEVEASCRVDVRKLSNSRWSMTPA